MKTLTSRFIDLVKQYPYGSVQFYAQSLNCLPTTLSGIAGRLVARGENASSREGRLLRMRGFILQRNPHYRGPFQSIWLYYWGTKPKRGFPQCLARNIHGAFYSAKSCSDLVTGKKPPISGCFGCRLLHTRRLTGV